MVGLKGDVNMTSLCHSHINNRVSNSHSFPWTYMLNTVGL